MDSIFPDDVDEEEYVKKLEDYFQKLLEKHSGNLTVVASAAVEMTSMKYSEPEDGEGDINPKIISMYMKGVLAGFYCLGSELLRADEKLIDILRSSETPSKKQSKSSRFSNFNLFHLN